MVMSFINEVSKGSNLFTINDNGRDDTMQRSYEENLVVGEVITEDIKSIIDDNQKTNYSFKLTKQDPTAPYFLNLIINETSEGYYAYIIKYEYDLDWYNQQNKNIDLFTYTGKVIYYKSDGVYLSKIDKVNGNIVNYSYKQPCPPVGNSNSNGGDGSSSNDGDGGSNDNSGGGNSVTSGQYWLCNWRGIHHADAADCQRTDLGGTWYYFINIYIADTDKSYNQNTFFRHPCDPLPIPCYLNNGDPCPPDDENPVIPVNIGNAILITDLNDLLCNDLTQEQEDWVNLTSENTDTAQQIQVFLQSSNSGGCADVDFDSLIRIIPDIDKQCQGQIIFNSILNASFLESDFGLLIKNSFLEPNNRNIAFRDIDLPSNQVALTSYIRSSTNNLGEIVLINLDNSYLDQTTDLGIVVTVYHELLHAYITNLYHDGLLLSTFPQYTSLNDAYDSYMSNQTNSTIEETLKEEMHNIYTDFIDQLADNIFQYAVNNNLNIDLNHAKNLVWGSLIGNNVFTNNLTINEQSIAEQLINNEILNNSNAISPKTYN